jgi:hypothetical protein
MLSDQSCIVVRIALRNASTPGFPPGSTSTTCAAAVVQRHPHEIGRIGRRFRHEAGIDQIDAERRPRRDQFVEIVDREIAADAAVGEPDPLRDVAPSARLPGIGIDAHAPQRHRGEQQRKGQTHAHRHDHRQVFHRRQAMTAGHRAAFDAPRRIGEQRIDDHRRKQRAHLGFVEAERLAVERKAVRPAVADRGRHQAQVDAPQAGRVTCHRRDVVRVRGTAAPEIAEAQRPVHVERGQRLQGRVQPRRQRVVAAEAGTHAETVARQLPSRVGKDQQREHEQKQQHAAQDRRGDRQPGRHAAGSEADAREQRPDRQRSHEQSDQRRERKRAHGGTEPAQRGQAPARPLRHQTGDEQFVKGTRRRLRLEQAEQTRRSLLGAVGRRRKLIGQRVEPLEAALIATVFGRRGGGGGDRSGRRAAHAAQAVVAGEPHHGMRVDDAAGDAAFHDDIAFGRRIRRAHCILTGWTRRR